jgi:hypothetical protein
MVVRFGVRFMVISFAREKRTHTCFRPDPRGAFYDVGIDRSRQSLKREARGKGIGPEERKLHESGFTSIRQRQELGPSAEGAGEGASRVHVGGEREDRARLDNTNSGGGMFCCSVCRLVCCVSPVLCMSVSCCAVSVFPSPPVVM